MLKKYFNNIGNIIKVLSGAMAVFVIGVFSILSFGNIDTPYSDNLDKHINTSTISLSKEYRSKRLLAYKRAALKSTTNFLKAKKYKELSFKRKVVNTKK